jgi:hypothetical protein
MRAELCINLLRIKQEFYDAYIQISNSVSAFECESYIAAVLGNLAVVSMFREPETVDNHGYMLPKQIADLSITILCIFLQTCTLY